jgi:ferredoxin
LMACPMTRYASAITTRSARWLLRSPAADHLLSPRLAAHSRHVESILRVSTPKDSASAPRRRPVSPAIEGPRTCRGATRNRPGSPIRASAMSVPWASRCKSLLEVAEACDVPTRWSCRTGVCHNCETVLLAVQVGYDFDPLVPPPKATSSSVFPHRRKTVSLTFSRLGESALFW